jgi:hypothetical protein
MPSIMRIKGETSPKPKMTTATRIKSAPKARTVTKVTGPKEPGIGKWPRSTTPSGPPKPVAGPYKPPFAGPRPKQKEAPRKIFRSGGGFAPVARPNQSAARR